MDGVGLRAEAKQLTSYALKRAEVQEYCPQGCVEDGEPGRLENFRGPVDIWQKAGCCSEGRGSQETPEIMEVLHA